jgi:signal transduction histidine kinase
MIEMMQSSTFRAAVVIFGLVGLSLFLVPTPLNEFLSANQFLPHATCYLRNSRLIWLHASTDMVIGLSYVTISGTLGYLVYRARRDIPFHWMFLAFGLFIVACGFTHFMEVWTVWQPVYWLAGYVKVVTAMASLSTAILLPPLIPKINGLVRSARLSEERKKALETSNTELAAANEELKAFTYSASHDLRAPLRTMSSMSELLSQSLPSDAPEETRQFAERIKSGAGRMNQLLDDLLTYASFYKVDAPISRIEPEAAIREVIPEWEADFRERDASIEVAADIPPVRGNATLLKLVFSNLIGNACKYVPAERDPRIEIRGESINGHVEISVSDNGYGIPKEYQVKIFEPFERLHRVEEHEGTGLGLAIVTRAVRKMSGQVGVESTVGVGSRFWVRLPKA